MKRVPRMIRSLGALAGVTGAAAALNRGLRATSAIPVNHLGGARRTWRWRGHEVFVTEAGSGSPIMLVHGIYAGASSYEYRKLFPQLATRHRVVAFDLVGCGLSAMPALDYASDLFVDQINDALDVFGAEGTILVGSSLGAAFAIRAAVRGGRKVRGLVAICPSGLCGVLDAPATLAQRAAGVALNSPLAGELLFNGLATPGSLRRFLRSSVYADEQAASPEIVAHYYAVAHQPGARYVPAAFIGGALNCNIARDLPFIEMPILVLWGRHASATNPVANAAEYLRLAHDGRLAVLESSGLLPQEEEPAAVAGEIEGFASHPHAWAGPGQASSEARSAMPTSLVPGIFKSYDVRGIYPSELSDELAYEIGRAFVEELKVDSVVAGRDMRASGEALFANFARGANEAGADVTDIGLVSTDALYFAVGKYGFGGGVMITASHNPANYNGFKLTRENAQALSLETGLSAIRDRIAAGSHPTAARRGTISQRDILEDFAAHCLSFIDPAAVKPFKIAIDAGNGMAGRTVPYVFKHLPCEIIPLFFELDGTFPNHPASPIEPENMVDLQRAVREHHCDLGVAFDGDADRMFIVDETGGLVGGDMVTALVGLNTLRRIPNAKILYNLICSRSVPEVILAAGGIPVRSPVGHSLIKKIMRDENIVFGGEHSGHFYFRDNWFADSGMIALLQCLQAFSGAGKTVSEVIAPIDRRFRSGEINSHVRDIPHKLAELQTRYSDAVIDHLDGVTIEYPNWWMNVRPSNTEPLLRLNVEGDTLALMERYRDAALELIRAR